MLRSLYQTINFLSLMINLDDKTGKRFKRVSKGEDFKAVPKVINNTRRNDARQQHLK